MLDAAGGDADRLEALLARRLTGEPLEWITGTAAFCGLEIRIEPGVYVPRPQTEALAERAAARLPEGGGAADLCTGSGAIARVLGERRPAARVVAGDSDERAVACARANGVDAHHGDLFAPLPRGPYDVVVAVVPYVPTDELRLLHHDALTFEALASYDGGADGLDVARRVVAQAAERLVPGGALLLELGGNQAAQLDLAGFTDVRVLRDEDGDERGLEATRA